MKKANKKYVKDFEKNLGEFVKQLEKKISTDKGEWTVKGFIDIYNNIYTISTDTKILSKILEIHIFPELLRFSDQANYELILAKHQNWYPDITFVDRKNEKIKFAVDIKTTFKREKNKVAFTLGSHGSYFKERDKKKNIQFPYNQYDGHYILGIVYNRKDLNDSISEMKIHKLKEKNIESIDSIISDFEFFVSPKWKIASDSQGSGNTANIGSIKDLDDIKKGNGVFSKLGEKWFDEYWINYGTVNMVKNGNSVKVTNIWDFLEFKGRTDLYDQVVAKGAKRKPKK